MASSFLTSLTNPNPLEIEIQLKDSHQLPQTMGWDENGHPEVQYLYTATDLIAGTCTIKLKQKAKVEHQGIKIELVGQVQLAADKGQPYEFTSLVRELEGLGDIVENKSYTFEFANVDKSYETYHGNNVRLRYFLRVKVARQVWALSKTLDFQVQNIGTEPTDNASIKMEVGIEDCLHIEFEYNKSKYHLQDVVIGKIFFLLVRIKIKHMEVVIIKRETTPGAGGNQAQSQTDSENIAKYEIMDGAPVRGESIPVRLFLSPYELTPSYKNVHNKFSVRYYLNLVLVDEEDRRYFKQQEITMWRRQLKTIQNPDEKAMFDARV